jgi:hypothetical protein
MRAVSTLREFSWTSIYEHLCLGVARDFDLSAGKRLMFNFPGQFSNVLLSTNAGEGALQIRVRAFQAVSRGSNCVRSRGNSVAIPRQSRAAKASSQSGSRPGPSPNCALDLALNSTCRACRRPEGVNRQWGDRQSLAKEEGKAMINAASDNKDNPVLNSSRASHTRIFSTRNPMLDSKAVHDS